MKQRPSNNIYYDEEECLGFGIFVAELELIVGTSRDRKPDQIQLLELLQKLQASIAVTESALIKQHQKRCETALIDVLYRGTSTAVMLSNQPLHGMQEGTLSKPNHVFRFATW
jgi:hypothetical protein